MTVHGVGRTAIDYCPCTYGESRVRFRGPGKPLDTEYVAFLGTTETYGRYIDAPFAALVEQQIGKTCVNLGVLNAGVDMYLNESALREVVVNAEAMVLQALPAQNLGNRFYRVHPRRNDRFLRANEPLQSLFPEIDFTEFHFTRHMLTRLAEVSQARFEKVAEVLREDWLGRMESLVRLANGPVILLWFDKCPPGPGAGPARPDALVTRAMLEALRPVVTSVIISEPSTEARDEGTIGMYFEPLDIAIAETQPGPLAHCEVAESVSRCLSTVLAL